MESAGTPDAPPPAPVDSDEKASVGMRLLAVVLSLALALGAAVMIVIALNPDDTPRCDEVQAATLFAECFDISKTQETIAMIFAWPAGIAGGLAALLGLRFAISGRRGALLMRLALIAIALGVVVLIAGRV